MVDLSKLSDEDWFLLYHAFGTVVVKWNLVEHPLDYCVAIIYHNCGGKNVIKKFENEVPISLSTKAGWLEACFKKLPILLPFKDDGISIVKECCNLSEERNKIIHMRLMGKNPDGSFLFDKIEYEEMHESKLYSYTINQFHTFGKEILDLGDRVGHFCKRLQQTFAPLKSY